MDVYHLEQMLRLDDNLAEWGTVSADCDAVQVFQFSLSVPFHRSEDLAGLLSKEERERASRPKFPQLRDRFVAAHAGLRSVLAALLDVSAENVQLCANERGKPYVPQTDLQFNMTHAGDLAVVAAARGRAVGVDIEPLRSLPDILEIAKRFFAPGEFRRLQACLNPSDLERAFFECWTRKEAYVKALGLGLSYPFANFEVTFFPNESFDVTGPGSERWFTQNIDVAPDYVGALVVEKLAAPCQVVKHMCVW